MSRLLASALADRRSAAALLILLAGAAALRLDGVRYGLPLAVLNPDEEQIVPRAWAIAHGAGLDPGFYDYPSLLFYLLAPVELARDSASYLHARLLVVLLGVAGVAASFWLGRSAYGAAAGWVAAAATAVATTHVAYSRVAVTDVPLTLGVTAALALAVAGRLEWAGLVAGLATATKYPGAVLAVPLLVAGWGRWGRLARAAIAGVAAFALASPFVLVHPGRAWDDLERVQRLARAGWLGFERDHPTPIAFLDRLWEAVGPLLLLSALGLGLALLRRRRADLVLALFVLAYFAQLLTIDAHFDRYVLPLVPALAVLAGRVPALAPLGLALLLVPLAWTLDRNAELRGADTRVVAHEALGKLATRGPVAADPSTPPLRGLRVVELALPGPGRPFDENRDLARLRARGVRYVLVTGAVADRVLAARERYPREARFYEELRNGAERVLLVEPDEGRSGPWVGFYRL